MEEISGRKHAFSELSPVITLLKVKNKKTKPQEGQGSTGSTPCMEGREIEAPNVAEQTPALMEVRNSMIHHKDFVHAVYQIWKVQDLWEGEKAAEMQNTESKVSTHTRRGALGVSCDTNSNLPL